MNSNYSQLIKKSAKNLGFLSCGISKAEFLEEEAPRFEKWLNEQKHGQMAYMENHYDKRLDPRLLVPGAKSVVSLLLNYYTDEHQVEGAPKISKYAYGTDYHFVIKEKLKQLFQILQEEIGEINGRVFVDSAPVMDKAWAGRSGLGWMGKNTNLINKKVGSFFFIAEMILDLKLDYDTPVTDHCGTCTACIDSCPTGALTPYNIDASRCISYLTIELKDQIPSEFQNKMDDWSFGCDICQDVCPWNRFSKPHNEPLFEPRSELLEFTKKDWEELTETTFDIIFKNSAVKRTRYKGLKRNLAFLND
ncbi:MAG: tRNA epoxyqueuosine(34) reductase QueG [Bacteroidota bacterium]|nr:tRNA epoxyqueuosine(34) reductase QueG [Bacteroidota bacterium]MEC7619196.1 tRNA epoxyqueuosine(34) reductase QueG [Bacteroidota bacterium]MEC8402256.1 tRNA epoxyqueuosine(34) reductase QueG [Bacteroidota bacterium]MEC9195072.1 tRNA epoxyqueuosine(34) reductase QueG [Bacteroidota bacterium]